MLIYNNTHIFTGFLKQLLADFNLPKLIGNKWTCIDDPNYYYNKKVRNKTRNLIIKDNIYDTYTHEYLGDYLRFQRDYNNLDLMPLYNCFNNKICSRLYIKPIKNHITKPKTYWFNFDADDANYKIYMLPIKLYKEYTIAIDSATPVELCCGIYGEYQPQKEEVAPNEKIAVATYTKFNTLNFNQPTIYTKLLKNNIDGKDAQGKDILDSEVKKYLITHITDLKLFIKVASNIESSIVILEGNYIGYNDNFIKDNTRYSNHFITNYKPMIYDKIDEQGKAKYKEVDYLEDQPFRPIGQLQLLRINTGTSYPFADRLIEYMLGNVVTNDEELIDNIKRIQEVMKLNKINHAIGGGSDLPEKPYKEIQENIKFKDEGIWENRMRPLLYDFIQNEQNGSGGQLNTYEINHDILGYMDKTTEKYYCGIKKDNMGNRIRVDQNGKRVYPEYKEGKESWPLNSRWVYETLTSIDIYSDVYLDDKNKRGK